VCVKINERGERWVLGLDDNASGARCLYIAQPKTDLVTKLQS
jgi:hypothetical protein